MNQNWWNAAKVGLRGKFIALKIHLSAKDRSQFPTNDINFHFKKLGKKRAIPVHKT